MLFGNVPFLPSDLSDEKLIKMIKKKQVKFPPLKFLTQHNPVSENCQKFIAKCLDKNPRTRMGSKNDFEELLADPWFSDINIEQIINKTAEPPYKPELTTDIFDVSNFDQEYINKKARLSRVTTKTKELIKGYQEKFDGFDS